MLMLFLTRKPGERVVIGPVVVEVLEVAGNRVRLGIKVPAGTPVRRGEVPIPSSVSLPAEPALTAARPVP
jgi:carbon storage regulator CsrA